MGDVQFRTRVDPSVVSFNLSVSGAKVGDVLRDQADAFSPTQFDSELDLVQFPKVGSQVEIAESHTGDADRGAAPSRAPEEAEQEGLLIGEYRLADQPERLAASYTLRARKR